MIERNKINRIKLECMNALEMTVFSQFSIDYSSDSSSFAWAADWNGRLMVALRVCAATLIPLVTTFDEPSINLPVDSATDLATLNPVLAKPLIAFKIGRFGEAAAFSISFCGTGVDRTNATMANDTMKIDAMVFMLND